MMDEERERVALDRQYEMYVAQLNEYERAMVGESGEGNEGEGNGRGGRND